MTSTLSQHQVPEAVRDASTFDPDGACFIAPDGRAWVYTVDPTHCGLSHDGGPSGPLSVAVWLKTD